MSSGFAQPEKSVRPDAAGFARRVSGGHCFAVFAAGGVFLYPNDSPDFFPAGFVHVFKSGSSSGTKRTGMACRFLDRGRGGHRLDQNVPVPKRGALSGTNTKPERRGNVVQRRQAQLCGTGSSNRAVAMDLVAIYGGAERSADLLAGPGVRGRGSGLDPSA